MARLFSRHSKGEQISAVSSGGDPAVFSSAGDNFEVFLAYVEYDEDIS